LKILSAATQTEKKIKSKYIKRVDVYKNIKILKRFFEDFERSDPNRKENQIKIYKERGCI